MKDRIKQIMELTGQTQQDFAAKLDISPASLSGIFNGRTNPTNNHVQAIHRAFPDISMNWLLFGEGEMLVNVSSEGAGVLTSGQEIGSTEAALPLFGKAVGNGDREEAEMSSRVDSLGSPAPLMRKSGQNIPHGGSPQHVQSFYQQPQVDMVNFIDKKVRKIREIRVFFDDGTYESFTPSSK